MNQSLEQENNYYTPVVSEFHVGFEYESLQDERHPEEDSSWSKEVIGDEWDMRTFIGYYCGDHIADLRVKYLNTEDIESLGFECSVGDMYDKRNLKFTNDKCHITKNYQNGKIIIEKNHRDMFYEHPEIWFTGIIKNKSELKRLLKQLGVL